MSKGVPKDAQTMVAILKEMGVSEYEPRVIHQMLDFTHRYVTDVLEDARAYSAHANKKQLSIADLRLAVKCKMDYSHTQPPPRELLMEVGRAKNLTPLPLIKPHCGAKLPPDRYCLLAPNYSLKSRRKAPPIRVNLPPLYGSSKLGVQSPGIRVATSNRISSPPAITKLLLTKAGTPTSGSQVRAHTPPTTKISVPMPVVRIASSGGVDGGGGVKRKRENDEEDYDKE